MFCSEKIHSRGIRGLNRNKPKVKQISSERQLYNIDVEPFKPKTFEEIKALGEKNITIKRERIKLEREAEKYGQLREIHTEILAEIKSEFGTKTKRKKQRAATTTNNLEERKIENDQQIVHTTFPHIKSATIR
jgi:hypothetical protein